VAIASTGDPDSELVRLAREGDRSAFNALVTKYRNRVLGIAARMLSDRAEAEDLAQDVFVKAYRSLRDFHGNALFTTWLYRIAANSCLNHNQRLKRQRRFTEAAVDSEIAGDGALDPHGLLEKKQLKALLEGAIRSLPEERRIVLILRDIEGQTYEEIAECLGIELGTVRSRLHRARAEVQAIIRASAATPKPISVAS